ncbi:hypothetical protein CH289_27570 [Rhodococcus sp. RS1C4]|nr:pentapeptide repeat-containing protein [Rhodococcus sp. RS1C4]OZC42436.1 hypothetical protein CH289_27570 [Rhodococcus sp. RS1C4]
MARRDSKPEPTPTKAWWVVGGIGTSTAAGLVLFYLFAWQQQGPFGNFYLQGVTGQQLFDSARTTVALIGIIGLGGAGFLAYRRQRTSEEVQLTALNSHNLSAEQFRHEATRTLRDRYTAAAEQLGSESFAIRLAGVYAMAALADDWAAARKPSERQTCINVLCAYLRTPEPVEPDGSVSRGVARGWIAAQANRWRDQSAASLILIRQEQEVRQAILSVIASKTSDYPDPGEGPWSPCRFDFTGAALGAVAFRHCRFEGQVIFTNATFTGTADFSNSILCTADFTGAHFYETAQFSGATLDWRVEFERATFAADAIFKRTRFVKETSFIGTAFRGNRVDFRKASFEPDGSTYVQPQWVSSTTVLDFSDAQFNGTVLLTGDALANAQSIVFRRTTKPWKVIPTVNWNESALPQNIQPRSWPPAPDSPEGRTSNIVRDAEDDDVSTSPAPAPATDTGSRVMARVRRILRH